MDERAESLMTEVVECFIKSESRANARMAVETLLWMIAERSGEIGRARIVMAKYQDKVPGLEAPDVPEPVGRTYGS